MASSVQEYIDRNNLQRKVHQRRSGGLGVQQQGYPRGCA